MMEELQNLFNKKVFFERTDNWVLPPIEKLYKESLWKIDNFLSLKEKLNDTKSLLNDKGEQWHQHTADINKAGLVLNHIKRFLKPEFLTNAWCKFYEILETSPLISTDNECFSSLHLCEAPGAFVSALNYYLCSNYPNINWKWFGNTLNPYYEDHLSKIVVVDDRLLFHTLENWIFGLENTGDVMSTTFLKDISEFFKLEGQVHLVTADGSFDCTENPGEQELLVSDLNFAEILICLHVLAPGGNFIIKNFTCFECVSVCTMFLLNCVFNKVHIFKPVTSKSGNSEIYVICFGFRGIDTSYLEMLVKHRDNKGLSLFPKSSIPSSFMEQLEKCNVFFTDHQILSIKENLDLFDSMEHEKRQQLDEMRDACVYKYLQDYSLAYLPMNKYQRLFHPKKCIMTAQGVEYGNKKLLYFKSVGGTFDNKEQRKNMSHMELLCDLEHRLNECFPLQSKRSISMPTWMPIWKEIRTNVKRKSYEGGITTGRTVQHVQNSKFGNPVILALSNEIILDEKVLLENHAISSHMYWNWEEFADLINESRIRFTEFVAHISVNNASDSVITNGVTSVLKSNVMVHNFVVDSVIDEQYFSCCKLFIVDPSCWGPPTFEQELKYRNEFIKVILYIIKVLHPGDSIILHVQSLLTRFQVGMMFMLLSLFTEVATLIPECGAPAICGQMWVLSNYLHPEYSNGISEHFELCLLNATNLENQSILEVIPITAICSGHFYKHLLELNNQYMLRRLRKLVAVEKYHLKNKTKTNDSNLL